MKFRPRFRRRKIIAEKTLTRCNAKVSLGIQAFLAESDFHSGPLRLGSLVGLAARARWPLLMFGGGKGPTRLKGTFSDPGRSDKKSRARPKDSYDYFRKIGGYPARQPAASVRVGDAFAPLACW